LVAGGEDRHPRGRVEHHRRPTHARQQAELLRPQHRPRRQHRLPGPHLRPTPQDVLPRPRRLVLPPHPSLLPHPRALHHPQAPSGSGARVRWRAPCPGPTGRVGVRPAVISSVTVRTARPPLRSAARTAYPSISALSCGGLSMSLATSSASTSPSAAAVSAVVA